MKKNIVYRWSIQTPNVYAFCGFEHASTLASYKNEVSGFVRRDRFQAFLQALKNSGRDFSKLQLVTSEEYWKRFDYYSYERNQPKTNLETSN